MLSCGVLNGCAVLEPLPRVSDQERERAASVDQQAIIDVLYQQAQAWEGVPYRLGGLSRTGIDCSGFVYVTYLKQFRVKLPRSTFRQSKIGDPVFRNDLRAADLVFFRTGQGVRHVGIYIEDGRFVHASKSRGVMLSSLANDYWSKRYWKAIRIQFDRP